MLQFIKGNLLTADVEALVNTVNCVGYMGKGVALQFKKAFPENFKEYQKACRKGQIQPGVVFAFHTGFLNNPKYIFNFPTKRDWREKSRLDDIKIGLQALVKLIKKFEITSMAIPPLGCGLGGLNWADVKPLIVEAFTGLEIHVLIFEPGETPNSAIAQPSAPAKMTKARALFIKLIARYKQFSYRLNLLEIQKLAYFLQEAGEPLKLNYVAAHYGPYAHNLSKVLENLEGTYIQGFKDIKPQSEIELMEGAIQAADVFMTNDDESQHRLQKVEALIEGFETPYGLELLATVHWLFHYGSPKALDAQSAVELVHKWNPGKKERFNPDHIKTAWQHLVDKGWIDPTHHLVKN